MDGFWKDKKVLVTGHTGFVGSWLCAVLDFFHADIIGFSLMEKENSLYSKIKRKIQVEDYYGDIRNLAEVEDCIQKYKPEIIFHLAAYGFVKECFENPDTAFSTNVNGTINLMKAIYGVDFVKSIIITSSDKVYENTDEEDILFSEHDKLGGIDPYSCSKTCEDMIARSYYTTYLNSTETNMTIVRPSNILGGGDHNENRLIPGMLKNLNMGKEIEIRNPGATRPWQNVMDMTDAFLVLAKMNYENKLGKMSIYNIGPDKNDVKTVAEIADYVSSLFLGSQGVNYGESDVQFSEHKFLGLSIEKIKKELQWKPKKSINDTLNDVYNFYQESKKKDEYNVCMEMIEKYYECYVVR